MVTSRPAADVPGVWPGVPKPPGRSPPSAGSTDLRVCVWVPPCVPVHTRESVRVPHLRGMSWASKASAGSAVSPNYADS